MSKMADMAQAIEDLHKAAATINDAADWLTQQFSETTKPEIPVNEEPESKHKLKLEDVRPVLVNLSRAGHTAEIRTLLTKYSATKLSQIDPANYEALMKDAEAIGNGK